MYRFSDAEWRRVNDFVLACGKVHTPRDFCVEIMAGIGDMIPYDRASIYFINDNDTVCDEALFGVDREWSKAYLDYYSRLDGGRWSIAHRTSNIMFNQVDFTVPQESTEFVSDYVKPQGIRYVLGFGLHDSDNIVKSVFCLDRTKSKRFSDSEMATMDILCQHFDNLHKNFYVENTPNNYCNRIGEDEPLTRREMEIARLLCEGVTPFGISKKLSLSQSTVYKHISNIHLKLHVSNRQELLLKLMDGGRNFTPCQS